MFSLRLTRSHSAAARLGVGFALFLAVAEVARNWGDWGWWPFWVVDYLAVALLLVGSLRTLSARRASLWLSGGWGFTCAMFYMSFFSHLAELRADPNATDHGPFAAGPLTLAIGVLFALTVVGFALSLVPDRRDVR